VEEDMVLMHRNQGGGMLVFETDNRKDPKTEYVLKAKKGDGQPFELSVKNKTLIKKESIKGSKGRNEKAECEQQKKDWRDIENMIKGKSDFNVSITKERIEKCLNHKFRQLVKYKAADGEEQSFCLADLILEAIAKKDKNKLRPYFCWKEWFIETKCKNLQKSVENNCIRTDQDKTNFSRRKQALQKWSDELIQNKKINLDECHNSYQIDELAEKLKAVVRPEKNSNEYHRALKAALQKHQREAVFGTKDAPQKREDNQLYAYNLEVVKYLEHYFPIKKSKRSASNPDYYLRLDTIKNAIQYQLENAVRSGLLQQGKFTCHEDGRLKDSIDSKKLSEQKADEAFALNLIGSCAFAANNIRNIVDPKQENDILSQDIGEKSLSDGNIEIFRLFYGDRITKKEVGVKGLQAMQAAVVNIRNEVIHYRLAPLNNIFNTGKSSRDFTATIFQRLLKDEIENASAAFAQQLKTGGVLTYFSPGVLIRFLETSEFKLYRSVVPFAPGFKNVMKRGMNYQNATKDKDDDFYDLGLSLYLDKPSFANEEKKEGWDARYFLLKTIYNNLFLPAFTKDGDIFKDVVGFVLKKNEKYAQRSKNQQDQRSRNKYAYAFNGIRSMKDEESIVHYMAYIQSHLRLEASKKEDSDKSKNINFEKFVLQVFVKGFDTFMGDPNFEFVKSIPSEKQINGSSKQEEAYNLNKLEGEIKDKIKLKESSIKSGENAHIAFYTFCKLLNASYLSTLRNEIIKYQSAQQTEQYKHLLAIIELCMLSADVVSNEYTKYYTDKAGYLVRLKPYIEEGENIEKWDDLYVQSYEETPVIHGQIELAFKYGTENLLREIIGQNNKFRIREEEFSTWKKMREEKGEKQIKRDSLHKDWQRAKNNKKDRAFIEKHGANYKTFCRAIDKYNWLDNKLHFVHLKDLHNLTIEILGRMAGFTALFERDLQYICKNRKVSEDKERIEKLDFEKKLPWFDDEEKNYLKEIVLYENYRDVRNYIAHFNHLTTTGEDYSIIGLLNELRELFFYDRKLKNAVSKSIIDLFDRHGMILKLKFEAANHHLIVESITPKKITHLGGGKIKNEKGVKEAITTNQVHPDYCEICRELLEYEKAKKVD
jgi:hypothetical protein